MRLITIIITIFIVFPSDTAFSFPDLMDIKHISAKGRVQEWNSLIVKWNSFWEIYKDKIYWDSKDRFFRNKGKELKLRQ